MGTNLKLKPRCCGKVSRHFFDVRKVDFSLSNAEKSDVTYRVFKDNAETGVYYTEDTVTDAQLDPEMPLVIIIHGWLSNESTYWYEPLRKELIKTGRYNLIYIDWFKTSCKPYDLAAACSKHIGEFIANFIIASKVNLKKVHVVGHSLGSHVTGFIGKSIAEKTGTKLSRITLTDPAAIGFELPYVPNRDRACAEDADFVDVIHSDMGHYGCIDPFGHVDFYPNGGKEQPGCPPLAEDARHMLKVNRVDFSKADCKDSDIKFRVFKDNALTGNFYTFMNIAKANLDPNIPLTLLIHDWLSNESTYWYEPFRDALYKTGTHNVVYVDWSKAGSKTYDTSAANSKYVGLFVGDFVIATEVDLKNVHVVGHSLGAHVAGFCGKRVYGRTCGKVGRITLADPCAMAFEVCGVRKDERACEDDAEFVDVVHSDMGHYGFIDPIGHADFYPNGGKEQPGCPELAEDDNCSHARANLLFIESIDSEEFKAAKCDSWEEFLEGDFKKDEIVTFGYKCPDTARGTYYFATNEKAPFAKGMITPVERTAKASSEPLEEKEPEDLEPFESLELISSELNTSGKGSGTERN